MTLESVDWISDYNPDYPEQDAFVNNGDNHIRNIKRGAKRSLPSSTAPRMLVPMTSGGIGNSYELNITPAPSTLGVGMGLYFVADKTNVGKATMTVNGLGPIDIRMGPVATMAGDIVAGQYYEAIYDGTYFQLIKNNVVLPRTTLVYSDMIDKGDVAGTVNIDWRDHDLQKLRATGNIDLTFTDPIGPSNRLTLLLSYGTPSGTTVTLPAGTLVLNPGYVTNQEAGGRDIIELTFDGSDYYARVFTNYQAQP